MKVFGKNVFNELIGEEREGKNHFDKFDMALYAKKMFGMFAGEFLILISSCYIKYKLFYPKMHFF